MIGGTELILVVGILAGVGIVGGAIVFAIRQGQRVGISEFLCDACNYDNERDCSRPERPNAKTCPDYKAR